MNGTSDYLIWSKDKTARHKRCTWYVWPISRARTLHVRRVCDSSD